MNFVNKNEAIGVLTEANQVKNQVLPQLRSLENRATKEELKELEKDLQNIQKKLNKILARPAK
jgi:hypothetical protein